MSFASDNTSGAAPAIMAAVMAANAGHEASYGADRLFDQARARIRHAFEAPEAAVHLVATGTAANALSLALACPPWGAVFCHDEAHVARDECGAPEFFTAGAKLIPIAGAHGRLVPDALDAAIVAHLDDGVHGVQPAVVSLTNLTEAGTLYRPDEVAALAAVAHGHGLTVHLDGSRLANALAATGAAPAAMTWRAGVDILSLGATKNGCLGVEAVVIFDPARSREFELRRKRGGHLFSKHRFLAAQMAAWLEGGLWLRLAAQANAAAARLAEGLGRVDGLRLVHPVEANMIFVEWPRATGDRLRAAGERFLAMARPDGREVARLVTSWCSGDADIARFLGVLRG